MIDINPGILLAQIVTFLIALFVVWKIAWGPLTRMMHQREQNIKNNIDAANTERENAERLRLEYDKKISESKIRAKEIITEAVNEGQTERQNIVNKANSEADKIIQNGIKELNSEKNRLISDLRIEVVDLAMQVSEKFIEKNLDKSTQDRIFKQLLDEVETEEDEGEVTN